MAVTSETSGAPVTRRRVFYIPGYDPKPPRRYRELYRSESAAQAEISGYQIDQRPLSGAEFGWTVRLVQNGLVSDSEIDVLVWSDIVKASMGGGIAATYWQLAKTSWLYITSGALRRLSWLRKGPVLAALYPVAMLLLQLLAGWIAGSLVAGAVIWILEAGISLIQWIGLSLLAGPGVKPAIFGTIGWGITIAVLWQVLKWGRAQDHKVFAYYLMQDYAFSAAGRGRLPEALEPRLKAFADRITAALREDVDEVLIVGHSTGAELGVRVLADVLRQGAVRADGPALAFLSLGQAIPMMSFLPEAGALRRDLNYLAKDARITWVDVSAPGDGCSFALCDPVAVSGVAPEGQRWPLVLSAAFSQTLKPATWAKLKRRYFRIHFQYLCAFDQPGAYDYFQITAGNQTLRDRFAGRAPSANRIDVAASGYTSMTP